LAHILHDYHAFCPHIEDILASIYREHDGRDQLLLHNFGEFCDAVFFSLRMLWLSPHIGQMLRPQVRAEHYTGGQASWLKYQNQPPDPPTDLIGYDIEQLGHGKATEEETGK
jgi:hypothetical protein